MTESCVTFEGNPWRPTLCRNCTRTKEAHLAAETSNETSISASPPSTSPPTNIDYDQNSRNGAADEIFTSQDLLPLQTNLPACRYGLACYRTNPDHFKYFSHQAGHERASNRNSTLDSDYKEKFEKQKRKQLRFIALLEQNVNELMNSRTLKDQELDQLRRHLPERIRYQETLERSLAEAYDDRERREVERKRILSIPRQTPSYWGPNALTEVYREIKIPSHSPEFHVINELLKSTITTHGNQYGTIYGRDPTELDNIISKNNQKLPDCDSSKYLKYQPLLTPLLDKQANEYWLFHGCSHHTLSQLLYSGYDPRVSNLKGMFGGGFYLAENSTKSNQYIPCPHCGENAISNKARCTCRDQETFIFSIVLYRVVLGDVHIVIQYDREKYCRRIDNQGKTIYVRRPPLKASGFELYDSVMGESLANGGDLLQNREFILYEKGQAYPEYVIDFRRSAANMRPPADIKRLQNICRKFLENTFPSVRE